MSIMGFKSFAKIFQFKFRFMFFKVNSAPKPEFTLQIEERISVLLPSVCYNAYIKMSAENAVKMMKKSRRKR